MSSMTNPDHPKESNVTKKKKEVQLKEDGSMDPTQLMGTALPQDVVKIPKMTSTGKKTDTTRNYVAVVAQDKRKAYVDFSLEGGPMPYKNKIVGVVFLTARFIATGEVGSMAAREDIPGTDYQRLSKLRWPICQMGPGSYFLDKWEANKASVKIAEYLLGSWKKQGLDILVTAEQLTLLIETATTELQSEDDDVFSTTPVGQ